MTATTHTERLNRMIADSIKTNWERPALSDFDGVTYQYRDLARKIAKLHLLYEKAGIRQGDRIALCGRNSAAWAVAFLSVVTFGAIVVPILHDFKSDNIHHLVNHSGAKLLFATDSKWEDLDPMKMPEILGTVKLSDFSLLFSRSSDLNYGRAHLNELFGARYPERFTPDDVDYFVERSEETALINYTSGSTGFSKGVMVSYRNLYSNLRYVLDYLHVLEPGDQLVCMLPMAHMYGLTIDFLHGIVAGCHLNFLTRNPSPRVIIEAFAKIKPKLIITVPLIIEKIIKTRVFPLLEKPYMKLMMHVPFVDDRLMSRIKQTLVETFGGNLQEMIIGGAGLNREVDTFLHKIGFPYTVGYGMTECAPLISYEHWNLARVGSCGRAVDRMELKIDSPDPTTIPGPLWVKGDNVMNGYYGNDEATQAIMDGEWMNTGDICTMDTDGYLYIRGRSKNMILGPSGQNIYPEEIEQQLNNMPYVNESIVVEEGGRLVALIYPDFDNATAQGIAIDDIPRLMQENVDQLNKELPAYSQLTRVKVYSEEFEKTPKRSIKRYLYQHT